MEKRELKFELRTKTGKNVARQLRREGLVPGIVYGKGLESTPITVNPKDLAAATAGEGGRNALIILAGAGALDGETVIVADTLYDAIKGNARHVDLHKINLSEKVRVKVAVNLVGTAAGVKEGGLLDFAMHTLEIECLPNVIPGHIDVDVTGLTIGHSFHVGDILVPAGIKVLDDPKAGVVSILGKAHEEAPAAE
jgi:large subunit ribosomal protein L25